MALRCLAMLLLTTLAGIPAAGATTVQRVSWDEQVREADLVGVVECVTAGGIVAQYRVVESWKGPAAGTVTMIRVPFDSWGPQYPLALVGERYLVAASRTEISRITSFSRRGTNPLWWRTIPADFTVPLYQGRWQVQRDGRILDPDLVLPRTVLTELRRTVPKILDGSRIAPEGERLRWLADGLHPKPRYRDRSAEAVATALVEWMVARAAANDPEAHRARGILEDAGGNAAIKVLEGWPLSRLPIIEGERPSDYWPSWRDRLLKNIRARLEEERRPAAPETPERPATPEVTPASPARVNPWMPEVIADLRAKLRANPDTWKTWRADQFLGLFEVFTEHLPEAVVPPLLALGDRTVGPRLEGRGYLLTSYFARRAGADRTRHLTSLLQARDPFVRVAAAVYLTLDDDALGLPALERLAAEPGTPGRWAALTLARHGRGSAMPRVLELLAKGDDDAPDGGPYNLRDRAMELLSNSAQAGGVPQPAPPKGADRYVYYQNWWRAHGDRVRLGDPWLPYLKTQRVD